MGNYLTKDLWETYEVPVADSEPTFDPLLGFSNGRKPREMIATTEELRAARVPAEHRDYCAHMYLKYLECQREYYPFMYKCAHQRHDHNTCLYEDYVLRMKEYERERRLRLRSLRQQNAAKVAVS